MSKFRTGIFAYALILTIGALPYLTSSPARAESGKVIYSCSACGFQQAQSGACPKCKASLTKTEVSYECPNCGMCQEKPGYCSMCGAALNEKRIPV